MAEKKKSTAGQTVTQRPDQLVSKLIAANNSRAKKDIQQWRSALQQAEKVDNPKRLLLYNLFDEIILDAHLTACIQKRIQALNGCEFNIVDAEGVPDMEATNLIKTTWFSNFITLANLSTMWGPTLIEIKALTDEGKIAEIGLVPRRHVIPEKNLFLVQQTDEKGDDFTTDPSIAPWVIFVGDPKDLGLLNKCVPHVLYKRFAQSSWAEFCQIFGMPVRFAKTNTSDLNSLNRLENMLRDMATSSYGVLHTDEDLQFVETAKSSGEVFSGLATMSNAELSKLINGAVIGEASKEGSRAKEQVGLDISEQIVRADQKMIEGIVNDKLMPVLLRMGYPVQDRFFRFERSKDIKAEMEIVDKLLTHFDMEPEDIKNIFGYNVKVKANPTGTGKLSGNGFFG